MSELIHEATTEAIAQAAERIQDGDLVAFPTETVYGLGADATNGTAVAKIFAAKHRPSFNPLIVHLGDAAMAEAYVHVTDLAKKLMTAFWPGGLTIVFHRKTDCGLSDLVSAGLPSVALRMPDHPVAQALLHQAGRPIAAPSANRSETISPTQARHVADSLGQDVGMILDGGACQLGLESTVVDGRGETPVILRPGAIAPDAIGAVAGAVFFAEDNPDQPSSPGQMLRHYAPSIPLVMAADKKPAGWAYLGFGPPPTGVTATLNLSPEGQLEEAAANLFAMLRDLDRQSHQGIAVGPVPDHGLGIAINDRLRRAQRHA